MASNKPTADDLVIRYASVIKDKVVLTTGISPNSLGAYFVQAIAKAHPALIILAGRNSAKAQATEEKIKAAAPDAKTRFLLLDLESMQSVRDAAQVVNGWADVPKIDVLVNNAFVWGNEYKITEDGFEKQLATNYLGHWLFTNLILEKVLASSAPRVINVSSEAHRISPFRFGDHNFDGGKTYTCLRAYGQSKTGNMLFSVSLAEKLAKRGLLSFSLHPGAIFTNVAPDLDFQALGAEVREANRFYGDKDGFVDRMPEFVSIEQGTATHVYAAFDPNLAEHNGKYLIDCRPSDPLIDPIRPWAYSPFEAEKLWRLSEELLGQKFSF